MEGIAIVCKSQFSFEDMPSPERLKSPDKNLQSFPWSAPGKERNLNESWEPPQGRTFLHICSAAELSLSSSRSSFRGPGVCGSLGDLNQAVGSSSGRAACCKSLASASELTCSCVNATELGRVAPFFCITVMEVRIWPKYLLQAAIQFSLPIKREISPHRTIDPKLSQNSLLQVRPCVCPEELMVMKKVTWGGCLEKEKGLSVVQHFGNS